MKIRPIEPATLVAAIASAAVAAFALLILWISSCVPAPRVQSLSRASTATFPLRASADGRYLVDSAGAPFFIVGDSAQSAAANLTTTELQAYLANRAAKGFNTINLNVMEHKFAAGNPPATGGGNTKVPTDRAGNLPFLLNQTGGAYTGAFGSADFGSPNDAYFANVAAAVDAAAASGFLVTLAYPYLGYQGGDQGWWAELTNATNTATKCNAFGQYLANGHGAFTGFKSRANIIWVVGGDFTPPANAATESGESRLLQILLGLQTAGATQLQTGDWASPVLATDEARFAPYMTCNDSYGYGDSAVDSLAQRAWNLVPSLPTFLRETGYELSSLAPTLPPELRRYMYTSVLTGTITGGIYGHRDVVTFNTATWWGDWDPAGGHNAYGPQLDSRGAADEGRLGAFFRSLAWWKLIPSSSTIVAGGGTFGTSNFVPGAIAADGSLFVAFVPSNGSAPQSITVSMTGMAGATRARWFNPTSGAYRLDSSSLANTGTHVFTTPGDNGSFTNDWALVLDSPPPPAPDAGTDGGADAGSTAITMGEPYVLGIDDSGNAGLLVAQKAQIAQPSTLTGLSFYVNAASGKLRLGVYDATGPGGGPGALKAQTSEITPVAGWNSAGVPPTNLGAGFYWLGYLTNDNNLHFFREATGDARYYAVTYGALPATFSTSPTSLVDHWSFYASLTTGSVSQVLTSIAVTPSSATVGLAGTQQFSAAAKDQFGSPMAPQPTFAWSVSGGGSISQSGLFTAGGANGGPFTVTASSGGVSGTAAVTVSGTITIGETSILASDDSGNGNLLVAQQVTLGQTATIKSLSFYTTSTQGKLRLGLYDASGPSGGPGAKKAEGAEIIAIANGWNTANVVTQVSLAAGTYWLAYLPSSNALHFRSASSGGARWKAFTYGTLPATFPTGPTSGVFHWSFFGTLAP